MTEERYHLTARLNHWIMALGFVVIWGSGYAMTTLVEEDSSLQEFLFDLHISVGVTLLVFLVLLCVCIVTDGNLVDSARFL